MIATVDLAPVNTLLTRFGPSLLIDSPDAVTAADLIAPDRLIASILALPNPADADRRALASIWSKRYLLATAPAILITQVIAGVTIDSRHDRLRLTTRDGEPAGLLLGDPTTGGMYRQTLETLIGDHYPAVFAAIQQVSGVSRRVLWANAANLLATIGVGLATVAPALAGDHADVLASAIVDPQLPAGFLRRMIGERRVAGPWGVHTGRLRRLCCLAYLAHEDGHRCGTCPLLPDEAIHDRLLARWNAR